MTPLGANGNKPPFVKMQYRTDKAHYKVSVQDASGVTAPTMWIPKDSVPRIEDEDKQYKAVIQAARSRSGLGRFNQWNFR